jgi:hypothetical protein
VRVDKRFGHLTCSRTGSCPARRRPRACMRRPGRACGAPRTSVRTAQRRIRSERRLPRCGARRRPALFHTPAHTRAADCHVRGPAPSILPSALPKAPRPCRLRHGSELALAEVRGEHRVAKRGAVAAVAPQLVELSAPLLPPHVIVAIAVEWVLELALHAVQRDEDHHEREREEVRRATPVPARTQPRHFCNRETALALAVPGVRHPADTRRCRVPAAARRPLRCRERTCCRGW